MLLKSKINNECVLNKYVLMLFDIVNDSRLIVVNTDAAVWSKEML